MWERRAWLSPRKSGVYDIIKTGGAFNNNGFGKISLCRGTDKLYLHVKRKSYLLNTDEYAKEMHHRAVANPRTVYIEDS